MAAFTGSPVLRALIAPAAFSAIVLGMFWDVLFSPARVLSSASTDLALQFLPWREFGFTQLQNGNLALWNPHVYGGTPYFAGFQSALLYPPNWLHLILPLGVAINWIIALHVLAAGYFTYLWCRYRRTSIGGSIAAGAMFMFSGPYFLHIYAGHLPHLCVMVWAPLILLSIDGLGREGRIAWALVGAAAVAMQIFAGHPQYVYYTAITCGVYVALLLSRSGHRLTLVGGILVVYAGGAILAAIHLLPGIEATGESVRGAGTAFEFASTFSLPPINLLTLIAPTFFGTVPDGYWGAGYLWEMCLFASVTGLLLAIAAAVLDRRWETIAALVMVGLMLLLALGRHTPLYRLMYDYVPYYDGFRGTVKFAYLAILFVSFLSGIGFDSLRVRSASWIFVACVAAGCALALLIAAWIVSSAANETQGAWGRWISTLAAKYSVAGELFTHHVERYGERDFITATGTSAARAVSFAALTGTSVVVILILTRVRKIAAYLLIVLLMVELFLFARSTRATMQPTIGLPPDPRAEVAATYRAWESALKQLPRDVRVLTLMPQFANLGMSMHFDNLWGYDPLVLRRYAELMSASQGEAPDKASQYLTFRQVAIGVFRMLRCGLILVPDANQPTAPVADPLPVATLVGYWVVIPNRESALAYLLKDDFDPRYAVVLENDPGIASADASAAGGSVEFVNSTTDSLELRARLVRPAILLITNNYAKGWRVRSLAQETTQDEYTLIPANYTQMAIPLQPGSHHLLVEYAPRSFRIGAWITAFSLIALVICGFIAMQSSIRDRPGKTCAGA